MAPVLRSKRSTPDRTQPKPKIKQEHVHSNIITEGMKSVGEPSPDNVKVLEAPRELRYSDTSISSSQESNPPAPQQANNRIGLIYSNQSTDQTQSGLMKVSSGTDLNGFKSLATVSVKENPFENFLQDISVAHGSKPVENLQEAMDKWRIMTPEQRGEFYAENYVLKLFNQVQNRDDIFNAVGFHPDNDLQEAVVYEGCELSEARFSNAKEHMPRVKVETNMKKTTLVRKPVKRLKTKARGVETPKKSPKIQGASSVLARRTSSVPAYKSFHRKIRQSNPGLLTVEVASLWRKMAPSEKVFYRMSSNNFIKKAQEEKREVTKQVRSNTKKVSKLPSPRRQVRKRKISRSTQAPENAFDDSESDSDARGGQLQVWTGNISGSGQSRLSWPRFEYLSKAIDKVKHLFD
ncbi:uncharacterized protein LOC119546697 [Drosophila subpulchrella]|uniref:uncharacterized protein LOC119546697 n=1 Tax=Drosophila subpulchrella TaxID=1486046 RepID=UPI0018A138C1|nr:uncharacterized protein LOC119546697 [Drosophila subpulchrella]